MCPPNELAPDVLSRHDNLGSRMAQNQHQNHPGTPQEQAPEQFQNDSSGETPEVRIVPRGNPPEGPPKGVPLRGCSGVVLVCPHNSK